MQKFIYCIILLLMFSGCFTTTEDNENTYDLALRNSSSSSLIVTTQFSLNERVRDSIFIDAGETKSFCTYSASNWSSFGCQLVNVITFRFANEKGYRCIQEDRAVNISEICLPFFDPFDPPRPDQINEDLYFSIIEITENDLLNAYELN